ncbi:MAG: FecR domain-containing protein [Candidatus Eisenbacteria bacterium]|nr:FecR domain-containing protein [Candidatus Eisenbacteria bacterium]
MALSDRSTLGKLLTGGARVDLADSVLVTIASAENVYLQILPGTQMDIPPAPGRWFGRDVHASIATGEVRITTGPRFPGARLTVETPEVAVVVSGTTVAVIRPPFGTCVCVLEGTVEVSVLGSGSSERVPAGRRFTFHTDGNEIDRGEMLPEERVRLGTLQSLCAPGHHPSGHGR